jgi:serine phosphatase RsbU (regulator of sigma subunit)
MEKSARRFARNVLIVHLVLLGLVVTLVYRASITVYENARQHALFEAREAQRRLASQTAKGIENFYASILADLDLLRRTEEDEQFRVPSTDLTATPAAAPSVRAMIFAPVLWNQLNGRTSHLFVIDRAHMEVLQSFSAPNAVPVAEIVAQSAEWLRTVERPSLSKLHAAGSFRALLAGVPLAGAERRLLVGVIPLSEIENRFLRELNSGGEGDAKTMLLDSTAAVVFHPDSRMIGASLTNDSSDSRIRDMASEHIRLGTPGDKVFDQSLKIRDVTFDPALVTAQPIKLPGERSWWLVMSSPLESVNQVVADLFSQAIYWAIFVIVSVTAILVSTAIQMIRVRSRLDRVQHEMLTRELGQAREIQLAWLPDQSALERRIDLAAINEPASHISGDFYNWFDLPDGRIVVTIGDVTGHGMAAAFLMATTQLLVRTTMPRVGDPGKCLEEVNHQLCVQVFNGQFVTMLILVIDLNSGVLDVATAGHPPPLYSEGESFKSLPIDPQLVLGIEPGIRFPTQRFELPASSYLLLYTDGVIDAQAENGDRFTTETLQKSLYGRFENANAIINTVKAAINEFRGDRELADDLTLVAIQLQESGTDSSKESSLKGSQTLTVVAT